MAGWIERCAGVLLHPGSLPGGLIDDHAMRFADLLGAAGVRVWQILPVGNPDRYGSPYQPDSAFAGNAALFPPSPAPGAAEVAAYVEENADWLPDYALFVALEARHAGLEWFHWPVPLRDREPRALASARAELAGDIALIQATQCGFERDWTRFKRGLNERGLLLFGDVPLFLAHHSADAWIERELFEIGSDGRCEAFMGVPPDAFAADGQWWGYPPFRWDAMARQGYRWWARRFAVQSRRFDLVRIDHFRGLAAFWRIPREARTAREGAWAAGPGVAALQALRPQLRGARLVAEDLGYITPDVVQLRQGQGIPGMRVLQFAFDGDPANPHLPQHHEADSVCYTGTHDNDTTLGWWRTLDEPSRDHLRRCLGSAEPRMPQALVDLAWASPAPLSIVPLQDLLGLGSEARMNHPGTVGNNWRWRFAWSQLGEDFAPRLRRQLAAHQRAFTRPGAQR